MQQLAGALCDSADKNAKSHGQSSAGLPDGWSTHPEDMFGHWIDGYGHGCWLSVAASSGIPDKFNLVPC